MKTSAQCSVLSAGALDRRMNRHARFSHVEWARFVRMFPNVQVNYGKPDPNHDDRWARYYARQEGAL